MATFTIKWTAPDTPTDWTHSRVYRSSTKTGTYNLLDSIAIGTYSYDDAAGSSTDWYKVSFYDGTNESSLSDPLLADKTANYANLAKLRQLTGLSTTDLTDANAENLLDEADRYFVEDVTIKHYLEPLRGNVDGSNTLFYTRWGPIADDNFDQSVDGTDVEVYYATNDANNEIDFGSEQTVSSVNEKGSSITMNTAPTSSTAERGVWGTYRHSFPPINYKLYVEASTFKAAELTMLYFGSEGIKDYRPLGSDRSIQGGVKDKIRMANKFREQYWILIDRIHRSRFKRAQA